MNFKSNIFEEIKFLRIGPKSLFIIWLFSCLDEKYSSNNVYAAEFAKYLLKIFLNQDIEIKSIKKFDKCKNFDNCFIVNDRFILKLSFIKNNPCSLEKIFSGNAKYTEDYEKFLVDVAVYDVMLEIDREIFSKTFENSFLIEKFKEFVDLVGVENIQTNPVLFAFYKNMFKDTKLQLDDLNLPRPNLFEYFNRKLSHIIFIAFLLNCSRDEYKKQDIELYLFSRSILKEMYIGMAIDIDLNSVVESRITYKKDEGIHSLASKIFGDDFFDNINFKIITNNYKIFFVIYNDLIQFFTDDYEYIEKMDQTGKKLAYDELLEYLEAYLECKYNPSFFIKEYCEYLKKEQSYLDVKDIKQSSKLDKLIKKEDFEYDNDEEIFLKKVLNGEDYDLVEEDCKYFAKLNDCFDPEIMIHPKILNEFESLDELKILMILMLFSAKIRSRYLYFDTDEYLLKIYVDFDDSVKFYRRLKKPDSKKEIIDKYEFLNLCKNSTAWQSAEKRIDEYIEYGDPY